MNLLSLGKNFWTLKKIVYKIFTEMFMHVAQLCWIIFTISYLPQVNLSLKKIEDCNTFTEFVQTFSQFGNEMVELAQLSGERQNVSESIEG